MPIKRIAIVCMALLFAAVVAYGDCAFPLPVLNIIVGTGQSLSQGYNSAAPPKPPVISTTAPYTQMMMPGTGVRPVVDSFACQANTLAAGAITTLAPMTQSTTSDGDGETIFSGLMAQFEQLSLGAGQPFWQMEASANGVSSQPYVCLSQGTQAYANAKQTVSSVKSLWNGSSNGNSAVVRGVTVTHGESDFAGYNSISGTCQSCSTQCSGSRTTYSQYISDLLAWQSAFNTDLQAITGQSQAVLLFTDSMSSYTSAVWNGFCSGNATTADVTRAQIDAAIQNPSKIIWVGPKYQLGYYYTDGVHLPAVSEELLGEKYGEAFYETFNAPAPSNWEGLYITGCTISTNVVTCSYNIPTSPLVLDTTWVSTSNYPSGVVDGFHYTDNSGSAPSVSSVALAGSPATQVQITLSGTPTGTAGNRCVDYAWTGSTSCAINSQCNNSGSVTGCDAGPVCGPRGNLHDSDGLVSVLSRAHTGTVSEPVTGVTWLGSGPYYYEFTTLTHAQLTTLGTNVEGTPFHFGQVVNVTGMTPSAYNGLYTITGTVAPNQFFVKTNQSSNPGAMTVAGTVTANYALPNWAAPQQFCF